MLIGELKKLKRGRGLVYATTHNLLLIMKFNVSANNSILDSHFQKISLYTMRGDTPPTPSPARSLRSLALPPPPPVERYWLHHCWETQFWGENEHGTIHYMQRRFFIYKMIYFIYLSALYQIHLIYKLGNMHTENTFFRSVFNRMYYVSDHDRATHILHCNIPCC